MTIEGKKRLVEISYDHMVRVLRYTPYCKDYGEAMKLATKLINEGYFLERVASWVFDEYTDCMVCNACYEKALANPEAPDEIMLTSYCPHCGAKMNTKE